jgi:carbamoyltransferase
MTAILGISAYYHDSAAALLVDGRIVAAAQEERFTRKKHDAGFPQHAINYCLAEAKLRVEDLNYIGFYDKPFLKFERLLETYLAYAPVGFGPFRRAMPHWLLKKLHLPREMRRLLPGHRKRFIFGEHHLSHAASAFYPSPFEEAAILIFDGVGEWATASYGTGRGNKITLTHELHFPHSLGMLYSAFTYFCGFKVNSGEYKLMGLAPYGEPRHTELILGKLLDLKEDGSFRLDMSYFNYCQGLTMTSEKFHRLFGGPPRKPETSVTPREMDIASSIQLVTEEVLLRAARHVQRETGMKKLCLAGGVALNCVANGRILREGHYEDVWIQPASDDAGGALGIAFFIWHQLLEKPREVNPLDSMQGSLLGPKFNEDEIRKLLDSFGARYDVFENDDDLCEYVADLMAQEKVIGWFQGRMEFGPRALGCRSIIGDARSPKMQSIMNGKIKFRESFRPFAPSVLEERVDEYFEMRPGQQSPYMALTAPVRQEKRRRLAEEDLARNGIDKLKSRRSEVPAVTHVDYSARIQTVDARRHGRYRRLLEAFEQKVGCPLIINTSFNVRGEPLVCTPEEAYRCFMATDIDVLVLERILLLKERQAKADKVDRGYFLKGFELD